MKRSIIYLLLLPFLGACSPDQTQPDTNSNDMRPFPDPKSYWCQRLDQVVIDGNLDEWSNVAWTDYFQDIEGAGKPEPRFKTRAKMAWNNDYLFIAAELEEPHVWATLTKRDTIIFYDNDFEVFIDPDGDNHHYYELEVNALETAWDLLLTMPYRDFGHVIDSWDISGLDVGVAIQGTLNNPEDQDQGWTVELALPFRVLEECNSKGVPRLKETSGELTFLVWNGRSMLLMVAMSKERTQRPAKHFLKIIGCGHRSTISICICPSIGDILCSLNQRSRQLTPGLPRQMSN